MMNDLVYDLFNFLIHYRPEVRVNSSEEGRDMKNHYCVRSDYCPSQKQSSEGAKEDRKERQLCPAGRSGRRLWKRKHLSCLKLSEISVGGRPREEEQWGKGKGRSKPRGRKMEDLSLEQWRSSQGLLMWYGIPEDRKGGCAGLSLWRALPSSRDETWRCRRLKLLSKKMTSLDVCFRNTDLLALWVGKREQNSMGVFARFSCQDYKRARCVG